MTLRLHAIAAFAVRRRRKAETSPKTCHGQVKRKRLGGKSLLGRLFMLLSLFVSTGLLSAGLSGDLNLPHTDTLHAVTVMADKGVVVSRVDTVSFVNSLTVADALSLNPGIHVGDNGGFSGLKTVSLRGMGSAHTAIYVDGIRLGNVQSGQNDLGMLGLENMESAVVDYAQNGVFFNTARPRFSDSPIAGKVRLSAGSFGTYLPSARLDFRLSDNLSLSANASGVFSKGDFAYGEGLERSNNDVEQVRAGLDLFGNLNRGEFHVKACFNETERGTPGPVDWPSEDRQNDLNVFLQGSACKRFSPLYTLHLSSKVSYDDIGYFSAYADSSYGQTEFQLNTSHDFQLRRWLKMSLAADVQWDGLRSSNYVMSRTTAFAALASSFRTGRFSADVALEYSGAFDEGARSRVALSPSAGFRYRFFKGLDMTGFARRAYRIPTFNELYYVGYGNPELKPEDALMTGLGLDFSRSLNGRWKLEGGMDGYFNLLRNKITSAPSEQDPAIWLPYNIGAVRSAGWDIRAGFVRSGTWTCSLNARWAFQSATDRTEGSYTYGSQIPYIARHTVIVDASLSWKGWSFVPLWQCRAGRTDGTGVLPGWNTLDLSVNKAFALGKGCSMTARLMSKNITGCAYEVVSGYPMPGRSIMCGIELNF